jgi:hypothetical protein
MREPRTRLLSGLPYSQEVERRRKRKPQIARTITDPTTAPTRATLSPAAYQPASCPSEVPAKAPATPRRAVRRKSEGSLRPGAMSLAIAPVMRPIRPVQSMFTGRFLSPARPTRVHLGCWGVPASRGGKGPLGPMRLKDKARDRSPGRRCPGPGPERGITIELHDLLTRDLMIAESLAGAHLPLPSRPLRPPQPHPGKRPKSS